MSNSALFDDDPQLMKCDGCGNYFEESRLKKCKACGKFFCPECRKVHDCREASVSQTVICEIQEFAAPSCAHQESVRSVESYEHRNRAPLKFIDTDGSNIGSAAVRSDRALGSPSHSANPTRPISFNESSSCDRCGVTVGGYFAVQELHDEMGGKHPSQTSERDISFGNNPPYSQGPEYHSSCPTHPAETNTGVPPHYSANAAPVENTMPVMASDELRCDGCGRIWKKSQLRKCKKCGAVLCPDCRENHKCGKTEKNSILQVLTQKSSARKSSVQSSSVQNSRKETSTGYISIGNLLTGKDRRL